MPVFIKVTDVSIGNSINTINADKILYMYEVDGKTKIWFGGDDYLMVKQMPREIEEMVIAARLKVKGL